MSTNEKSFLNLIDSIILKLRDRGRIEFKEPLSIAATDSWPRSWVREARVVRGVLMLTVKTEKDMFKTVATACPEQVIINVHNRLCQQNIS